MRWYYISWFTGFLRFLTGILYDLQEEKKKMNLQNRSKRNHITYTLRGVICQPAVMGCILLACLFLIPSFHTLKVHAEEADSLSVTLTSSGGQDTSKLKDSSTESTVAFNSGEVLTVKAEEPMQGLYIKWRNCPNTEWILKFGGEERKCGTNGFLHEYVELPEGVTECEIRFSEGISMCDLFAYGGGDLPGSVQRWDPPCDKADFLVFSTHADDEILFLGGVLVDYAGVEKLNVQLAYMTNYWNAAIIREHEKLDGIWECGVHNYPVIGPFPDEWAKTYDDAVKIYDPEEVRGFVTEQIRRFKPQVVVTQDLKGEYGHGGHEMLAQSVIYSVDNSMNDTVYPDSAAMYGVWDVPKTYLHLYPENTIHLDLHIPLEEFGGRTAIEVAADAYKKHVSQQWCWFYVSDDEDYDYSVADFGMYRTTVGADTGNDMMENLISYAEQDRIEKERLEEEKRQKEEQARLEAEKASEEASEKASEEAVIEKKEKTKKTGLTIVIVIVSVLVVLIAAFFAYVYVRRKKEEERRRKRRLERRRREREAGNNFTAERQSRTSAEKRSSSNGGERKTSNRKRK